MKHVATCYRNWPGDAKLSHYIRETLYSHIQRKMPAERYNEALDKDRQAYEAGQVNPHWQPHPQRFTKGHYLMDPIDYCATLARLEFWNHHRATIRRASGYVVAAP